jgi:hypothetical protein
MKDKPRPDGEDLIAVVSGWEKFLLMAKTMLLAANLDAESLIIRSTKQKEWKNGLNSAAMIICDSLCALHFPNDERIRRFQLISDESLSELRNIRFQMILCSLIKQFSVCFSMLTRETDWF